VRALLFAGRFLTRAPLPDPGAPVAGELGRAALYYPLVGLGLGALLAGLALGPAAALADPPALVLAAVVLFGWVWATGALHLDGLADCADAWVGGLAGRERTFAILADPHTGAMGVVALVLVLLAKFAALTALVAGPGWLGLLLVPALARAQLLILALTTPAARPTGMGATLRGELPRRAAVGVCALTWAAALVALAAVAPAAAALAAPVAALVLFAWRRSVLHRLGGFTGDTAGALVELTETALLLTLSLLLGG
jgi:adenosylcobinamide-GDP ribazoletransferase